MQRVLVITLLEYATKPNNRIHHTVSGLRKEYGEVYLLYRRNPDRRGGLYKIKNLFPFATQIFRKDYIHMIEYNPPLNWVEWYDFSHETGRENDAGVSLKKELSNLFGLLREFCFIGFILYTSLIRLRGIRFDVCLVETSWEGIVALVLRKLRRVGLVVFDDNDFSPGYMQNDLRRRWELAFEKFCIRSSDLVISSGSLLADLWQKETGCGVVVIPNGVDLERFRGQIKSVNKDSPTLVYVGNISSSWMDFHGIFQAMILLLEKYSQFHFVIVGGESGERLQELKESAAALGISEHVEFPGKYPHDEVPDILSKCDIGLALTPPNLLRRYAFPIKVPEYMALGLPVIVTRDTEAEYIVEKYDCGVCVGPDASELKNVIVRLFEDEELFSRYSANGLQGAKQMDIHELTKDRVKVINHVYRKEFGRV